MTLQDIIDSISFRLGNRKGMEAHITREVKLAQQRLERDPTCDWWFLRQRRNITFTDSVYTFEADIVRPVDDQDLLILATDGSYTRAMRAMADDLLVAGNVKTTDYYALEGRTINLYPFRSGDQICNMVFIVADTQLSLVTDSNLWTENGFACLMTRAGIAMAQAIANKDALQNFVADYNEALVTLQNETIARYDNNYHQVRG